MMPGSTLADALTDFANATQAHRGGATVERDDVELFSNPVEPPSIDDLVALEAERVRADVIDSLKSEHEAELEAERERHSAEIAELASRFGAEAAGLIEKRLSELEARLIELTTSVTARILGTSLSDEIRARSVDRLAETIRAALSDNEAVRIRVRGAPSLCQALESALGDHAGQIDFGVGDGFDLAVTIDDSIFETRLSEWSAAMAEVFE